MDSAVMKASLTLENSTEKPENIDKTTPVTLTDDGVAIPANHSSFPYQTRKLNACNDADVQQDKENEDKEKPSKNVKVRTFSNSLWYVALVRTNCEQKTNDVIDQFDSKHRVNVWLPRQKVMDNKGKETYKMDIHGYVFFHLPKQNERNSKLNYETLREIRCISYVRGLLTDPMTQEPAKIPNFQIQKLKDMLNDYHYPTTLTTSMVDKGTRVRVVSGTLKGIVGTVEDIRKDESEIYIALDYLGCAVTVIKTNLVVPIDEEKEKKKHSKCPQVSMQDWLAQHTYSEVLSCDKLYVNFANTLEDILSNPKIGVPLVKRKDLSLMLATYIEDKQTRLGLFSFWVEMGYKNLVHPLQAFFPDKNDIDKIKTYMANYDPKKANVVDLMYFLQHNDNGKLHSLSSVEIRARILLKEMENKGYDQLPSNSFYATNLLNTLQSGGLKGLKRLMTWMAQRIKSYSYNSFQVPCAEHLFCNNPDFANKPLLSLVLQLSKRLKAKNVVTRNIEKILSVSATNYEVVGCYKKAIHLRGIDGNKHIVYLDDISGNHFVEGEHYLCKIVEMEEGKWFMVEPPLKIQAL